jgi:hypothetical protein
LPSKKKKKKGDDNVAAVAFFAIEGNGSKLTTIAFCDAKKKKRQ